MQSAQLAIAQPQQNQISQMMKNLNKIKKELTQTDENDCLEVSRDQQFYKQSFKNNQCFQQQRYNTLLQEQMAYHKQNTKANNRIVQPSIQEGNQQNQPNSHLIHVGDLAHKKQSILDYLKNVHEEYTSTKPIPTKYEDKINYLIDDDQEELGIGNTISLYEMVHHFKEILTPEILAEIQRKAFNNLLQLYQQITSMKENSQGEHQTLSTQSKLFEANASFISLCQLISECGYFKNQANRELEDQTKQIVEFFLRLLLEQSIYYDQCLKVLSNMGLIGFGSLLQVVQQDFQQISQKILNSLCRCQVIVKEVIVPILINTLEQGNIQQKNIVLIILSKVGKIAYSETLTKKLVSLFMNNNLVDKCLLIDAIIAINVQLNSQLMIKTLQHPKINQEIAIIIVKVLSFYCNKKTNHTQNIQQSITELDVCVTNVFPSLEQRIFETSGNRTYHYQGSIKPGYCSMNQRQKQLTQQKSRLFIDSRQLVLHIQQFIHNSSYSKNDLFTQQMHQSFILPSIFQEEEGIQTQLESKLDVLQCFENLLSTKKQKLLEEIIQSLSPFSLQNQNMEFIEKIFNLLNHKNPSVRSGVCLTLSKWNFTPTQKMILKFADLLKDNFWKVKVSACVAIGQLVRQPYEIIIENLIKCLKDGCINRQLVCKILLKINQFCQQLLLQILNSTKNNKIQQAILFGLSDINLNSELFQSVIDNVKNFIKHQRKQIRYACLTTVTLLRNRCKQQSFQFSFFKDKNIIRFYYSFLQDKCPEIRQEALFQLQSFGSYSQLLLIEGLTKGKVNCKIVCAKALGRKGVQNFRALVIGLRDPNLKVRQACFQSILENFDILDIVQQYKQNKNQCISLLYNLKDLIQGQINLVQEIKQFLIQVIAELNCFYEVFKTTHAKVTEFQYFSKNQLDKSEKVKVKNYSRQKFTNQNSNPNIMVQKQQFKAKHNNPKISMKNPNIQNKNKCSKDQMNIKKNNKGHQRSKSIKCKFQVHHIL